MCQVPESLLVKSTGQVDDERELTNWVEYRLPGTDVIVHRSVHVTLKTAGEVASMLTGNVRG